MLRAERIERNQTVAENALNDLKDSNAVNKLFEKKLFRQKRFVGEKFN